MYAGCVPRITRIRASFVSTVEVGKSTHRWCVWPFQRLCKHISLYPIDINMMGSVRVGSRSACRMLRARPTAVPSITKPCGCVALSGIARAAPVTTLISRSACMVPRLSSAVGLPSSLQARRGLLPRMRQSVASVEAPTEAADLANNPLLAVSSGQLPVLPDGSLLVWVGVGSCVGFEPPNRIRA